MISPSLVLTGAALLLGLACGWTARDWKADSDELAAVEAAEKAKDAAVEAVRQSASNYEDIVAQLQPLEVETRNTIHEVYRNVEVPADCAVSATGIRLLEQARLRANAAAAGEPVTGVRPTATGTGAADRPRATAVGG